MIGGTDPRAVPVPLARSADAMVRTRQNQARLLGRQAIAAMTDAKPSNPAASIPASVRVRI
ncbi:MULTISPECIES: hypothetical protein [unclassified Methylobacterium]|uniref:hypothetical protein n=1 Tax=unclassified Methylobacterium TaxID=2615210 RepID=UPI001FB8EE20|nr:MULTISPECIES: hypothetical protein [unclassified Methylobacterium]MCJ2017365.1 hypothetical protein [Methylobacterium sp. E-065]